MISLCPFLLRRYSQAKFLHHEAVSCGLFNETHNGGVGSLSAWEVCMQNKLETVDMLVQRLANDFENTAVKLRKPYNAKEVDTLTGFK